MRRESSIGETELAPLPTITASIPPTVGYETTAPTLCIGLDIAWFGGSKGKPASQHDCLVYTTINVGDNTPMLQMWPVPLNDRDPDADQIFRSIKMVVEQHSSISRVVLAIDAPLQGNRKIPNGRVRARRACEEQLGATRKAMDQASGGSNGWHPNIQPGMPLPPRVQKLLTLLGDELCMGTWTETTTQHERLIIECFPAEAIWAVKQLGGYPNSSNSTLVKSYKKQGGSLLSEAEVKEIVERVLTSAFEKPSGIPDRWPHLVEELITEMLKRPHWQVNNSYRGGKLLDDVIDSAICLATALSYAHCQAHAWYVPGTEIDGHIIGPGKLAPLLRQS